MCDACGLCAFAGVFVGFFSYASMCMTTDHAKDGFGLSVLGLKGKGYRRDVFGDERGW